MRWPRLGEVAGVGALLTCGFCTLEGRMDKHVGIRAHIFEVGGQKYGLRFSTNALVSFEELLGRPFGEVIEELGKTNSMGAPVGTISFTTMRALLWAGMVGYARFVNRATPGLAKEPTIDDVGELMDEHGLLTFMDPLTKALMQMFPTAIPPKAPGTAPTPEQTPASELVDPAGGASS